MSPLPSSPPRPFVVRGLSSLPPLSISLFRTCSPTTRPVLDFARSSLLSSPFSFPSLFFYRLFSFSYDRDCRGESSRGTIGERRVLGGNCWGHHRAIVAVQGDNQQPRSASHRCSSSFSYVRDACRRCVRLSIATKRATVIGVSEVHEESVFSLSFSLSTSRIPSNRFFLLVILSVPLFFRSSARFPPLSLFFPPLACRDAPSSFLVRLLNLRVRLYIRRYLPALSCTSRSFDVAQCRANF